jgi:hypothetical protein
MATARATSEAFEHDSSFENWIKRNTNYGDQLSVDEVDGEWRYRIGIVQLFWQIWQAGKAAA